MREHAEDIPLLAKHLLQKISKEWQTDSPKLNKETLEALNKYTFPGNVRELENILERAMTLHENNVITVEDLQLPTLVQKESAEEGNAEKDNLLDPTLLQKEREVIEQALEKTKHNKTAAAKLLGISFRALRYRIKKLGID